MLTHPLNCLPRQSLTADPYPREGHELQTGAETPSQGQGSHRAKTLCRAHIKPQLHSCSPTPCWQRAIFQWPVARQQPAENELMLQMFSSSMSNACKGGTG